MTLMDEWANDPPPNRIEVALGATAAAAILAIIVALIWALARRASRC